jgi:tetratricopeptide (TPR) repeat protein
MDEEISDQEYLFINLNNIGISLYKEKKYKEAIKYFEKAIKIDDTKQMIFFNKAKCEESLQQFNKAIEDYEKGLSLDPKNTKNLRRLALLYQKVGNFDKSIENIDKALDLEPENEEYKKVKRSNELLKKEMSELKAKASGKNYSEVEKLCKTILKEAPQAYIAQLFYIIALWSSSKHKEIIKFLQEDVSEENKNINKDLNYYLAFSLSHECQFEEAKEIIDAMIKEDIKDSLRKKFKDILKMMKINESKLIEGDKLTKEGKYEEAIKLYDSALENEKNSTVFKSKILTNRGICYNLMNENKKALKDLNESTIVNPDYSLTYIMKGMINFS